MDLYRKISFKSSKIVTRTYSTSFYVSVSTLPKKIREAVFSIYGFVRLTDEIVDTFHDRDQRRLLDRFVSDYREALQDGFSMNPILNSFVVTIRKYGIDPDQVDAFIDSMRADLDKSHYATTSEMNRYIYGSADVVGLMCLRVFVKGDQKSYEELVPSAMRLGSAFQKVNFLRDLKNDTEELKRVYFPQLNGAGLNESSKKEIVGLIEEDFAEARKGISKLPGKSKLAVYIAFLYYSDLLKKLKKRPASEIIKTRLRISDIRKLFLFIRANLAYRFNAI